MGNKMHPPSPRLLRLPDDGTERGGRADTPEGNAGDPDDGRGARCLDACAVEWGESAAAAVAGRCAEDGRARGDNEDKAAA